MTFDLYEIGGPIGFYVGQAKRTAKGGWERRVAVHRIGEKGSRGAHQLLAAGARARCLGSVCAERAYVTLLEARSWDRRVAAGWVAVHSRPWQSGTDRRRPHSARTRAKIVAALKKRSPEERARKAAEHSAKLRGRKLSPEHCKKISVALRGKKHSASHIAKVAAALRTRPPYRERHAPRGSPEHRAKVSAALRGRRHSLEARAKMSLAAKNRSPTHRAKLSAAQRAVWAKRARGPGK